MHAGFFHLGLNLYALYSIAPEAEAVLGYWTFTAVYLGSGLLGSVLCFLLTNSITVGASGAVFGLIGAPNSCAQCSESHRTHLPRGNLTSCVRLVMWNK